MTDETIIWPRKYEYLAYLGPAWGDVMTVGKEYSVLDIKFITSADMILIRDDEGVLLWIELTRFSLLEEDYKNEYKILESLLKPFKKKRKKKL